jgi:hypothetical protein
MGGRPCCGVRCRHFLRTSARCHRNSVRGVTRRAPRDGRGRWQDAAASRARSAARRCGRHLAAQDLELVAKDQQLHVLDVQTAATPNERSQQRPEREVEQREKALVAILPSRPRTSRHEYWRPSGRQSLTPPPGLDSPSRGGESSASQHSRRPGGGMSRSRVGALRRAVGGATLIGLRRGTATRGCSLPAAATSVARELVGLC